MLKHTIFREYDIRGIAETELLSAGCGRSGPMDSGTLLQRKSGKSITLWRDCRLSSALSAATALLHRSDRFYGCERHRYRRGAHAAAVFFGGAPRGRWSGHDHRQPQSQLEFNVIRNRLRLWSTADGETIQEVRQITEARSIGHERPQGMRDMDADPRFIWTKSLRNSIIGRGGSKWCWMPHVTSLPPDRVSALDYSRA